MRDLRDGRARGGGHVNAGSEREERRSGREVVEMGMADHARMSEEWEVGRAGGLERRDERERRDGTRKRTRGGDEGYGDGKRSRRNADVF